MGADLLIATAWLKTGTTVDEIAGRAALATLPPEDVAVISEESTGWELDTDDAEAVAQARSEIGEHITALVLGARDISTIVAPGGEHYALVTGGMSWGDDPSDTYTALAALSHNDAVWAALGFVA